MTAFVIDANILFSALISGAEKYLTLFDEYSFYTVGFSLLELDEHSEMIYRKTSLSRAQLQEFSLNLFSRLTIVPTLAIPFETISTAFRLCASVDEKDTLHLALALHLNLPLLSRDKSLCEHLKTQGVTNIMLWNDFIDAHFKK